MPTVSNLDPGGDAVLGHNTLFTWLGPPAIFLKPIPLVFILSSPLYDHLL
jgi:hypothetical protein